MTGRLGWIFALVSLAILEIATIWYVASTEVVVYQDHPLLWEELRSRLRDPGSWGHPRGGPLLRADARAYAGHLRRIPDPHAHPWEAESRKLPSHVRTGARDRLGEWLPFRPTTRSSQPEPGRALPRELVGAVGQPSTIERASHAPLTGSRPPNREPVWNHRSGRPGRPHRWTLLPAAIRGVRLFSCSWSHKLPHTLPGSARGAFAHQPSAPHFFANDERGACLYQLLRGRLRYPFRSVDCCHGVAVADGPTGRSAKGPPEAARVGRMPDFKALGYRCDWLYAGSPTFRQLGPTHDRRRACVGGSTRPKRTMFPATIGPPGECLTTHSTASRATDT